MISQIKTDDELSVAWWQELQSVKVSPDGTPFDANVAVGKAVAHIEVTIPAGGIYCIATQTGHQAAPHHKWFRTIEAAARYAVYESVIKHVKGIWYATSSYSDEPELNRYGNPSRSTKNVVGVKSLWVDLDVTKPIPDEWVEPIRMLNIRADKAEVIAKLPVEQQDQIRTYLKELDKYHSQQDAVEGLVEFIRNTGLTPSSVLSSGRGIHAYWYIEESLSVNTWKQLADGLKGLCEHYGLKADPMRTADAASLMRLPGTWHRKGEPHEVVTLKSNAISYKYEAINALVREKLRIVSPSVLSNMKNKHAPTGVAAALIRPSEFPPANAELVASKCQQVRFFRQSKGNVDEPLWYVIGGTLAYCVEGASYFQEWSSGHPQYTPQTTADKMEQWVERATGPSSCSAFESKNPTGCAGCKFKGKIAYPVQLGEEVAETISEFAIPTVQFASADGSTNLEQYVPPTQIGNFRRTVAGIQVVDDALPAPITICDQDVWVTRNSHDKYTDVRVVNLCYKDHHGYSHEYQLKSSILSDQKSLLTWLYDKGLYIKPDHAKAMSHYLQAYIADIAKKQKTITLHPSMGWAVERDVDGRERETVGFVLGNRLITKTGTVDAGLSPRIKDFSHEYHSMGNKERWVDGTKIFGEQGLESHAFAFLCGFAAPLMRFTGNLNAAIINLVGTTGMGKTSSARYGLSIYGNTKHSLLGKNTTINALYTTVGLAKNLPVCMDEMTETDPAVLSQMIYTISSGQPKLRLKSDASLQTAESEPWHTIIYMTTNNSLLEKIRLEKADPTAAMARMLEFRIEYDDRWIDFCEHKLPAIMETSCGSVGEEYLAHIVKNQDAIREALPKVMTWVRENGSGMSEHRFLNAAVACTIIGAQIAKQLGLIQFDTARTVEWVLNLLKEYGGGSRQYRINPNEIIGTYLSENNGKILSIAKNVNGVFTYLGELPRGVIVARLDMQKEKLYIRKEALERWMTQRRVNHAELFAPLIKSNVMDRGIITLNISEGMPGLPPTNVLCYVLDAKALGVKVEVENVGG